MLKMHKYYRYLIKNLFKFIQKLIFITSIIIYGAFQNAVAGNSTRWACPDVGIYSGVDPSSENSDGVIALNNYLQNYILPVIKFTDTHNEILRAMSQL